MAVSGGPTRFALKGVHSTMNSIANKAKITIWVLNRHTYSFLSPPLRYPLPGAADEPGPSRGPLHVVPDDTSADGIALVCAAEGLPRGAQCEPGSS